MTTTELHGKHRLGGKHCDRPLATQMPHGPSKGRHAAHHLTSVPPSPNHPPRMPAKPTYLPAQAAAHPANIAPLVPAPAIRTTPVITGIMTATPIRPFNHKGMRIAVALTTGALALIGGSTLAEPPTPTVDTQSSPVVPTPEPITADPEAVVAQPKVEVGTIAAPPPAPVIVEKPVAVQMPTAPPVVVPRPVAAAPVSKPAPPPAPAVNLSRAQRIVSAALSQVGEYQDCVEMVADTLAAVGIYHYKWPVEYYQIGYPVAASGALPGDLIYYADGGAGVAHIAVYIGNGQAVHGGWNYNQTKVFTVYVGSGPNFIRLY